VAGTNPGERYLREAVRDLGFTGRALRRRPGLLMATLLTLALGVGATTALLTMADHVYLRPLPYPAADRLHTVWGVTESFDQVQPSYPDFRDWRGSVRSAELVFALGEVYALGTDDGVEQVVGGAVADRFFQVFGTRPLLGRTFADDEEREGASVVVLSHRLWMRTFGGDPAVVGSDVVVNGTWRRVVGVMPAGFEWPQWAQLWEPLATAAGGAPELERRDGRIDTRALARVRDGYSPGQAEAELRAVAAALAAEHPDTNEGLSLRLESVREAVIGDVRASIVLMAVAAALILILTCANVAAMLLGRSLERGRELAVCAALGADRGRLVRQLLTENAALALAGGLLGTGLAVLAVRLMARSAVAAGVITGVPLPRLTELGVDGRVLAVAIAVTLAAVLLMAIPPAIAAVGTAPAARLRQQGRGGGAGRGTVRAQVGLAVAQLAIAVAMIGGATLLMRTLEEIRTTDPGFEPSGLVVLRVFPPDHYPTPEARLALYDELAERASAVPGVAGAALINHMPYAGGQVPTALAPADGWPAGGPPGGAPGDTVMGALFRTVSSSYFAVAGQRIVRGRGLAPEEARLDVVVLSEGLARLIWPDEDPIGRRLRMTNPNPRSEEWGEPFTAEIVGVAADVRNNPRAKPLPTVYVPHGRDAWGNTFLVVRGAGRAEDIVAPLRTAVAEVDPTLPTASIQPLVRHVHGATQRERAFARLMSAFGLVAMVLAGMGTYGALSNLVARRLPELGVRAALGARPAQLRRLVLRRAGWMLAAGTGAGALLAVALGTLMEEMLFGVVPADLASVLAAAALLIAVGVVASAVPAVRAGRADPARLLGSD
jgi:putative ABC transport system permease protein